MTQSIDAIVATAKGNTTGDLTSVESLIRPRKDRLVQTIGDLYDFKLNVITGNIELNNKPISGNFLRTFYLELAEKNSFDINRDNAANVAILLGINITQ